MISRGSFDPGVCSSQSNLLPLIVHKYVKMDVNEIYWLFLLNFNFLSERNKWPVVSFSVPSFTEIKFKG